MFIRRFYNQADSGGAQPAPATPAPAVPADAGSPASTPAATTAPNQADQLRAAMKNAYQHIQDRNKPVTARASSTQGTPLPSHLTQQPAPTTTSHAPALTTSQSPALVGAPAAPADPASAPAVPPTTATPPVEQAQTPASIQIAKFGKTFSMQEIETAIEGFNYYQPKVMQLNEDFARLAQESQRIEALKTAPENMLIAAIQGNEQVRDQVLALISQLDPQTVMDYKAKLTEAQSNEQVQALKGEIKALQDNLKQWETAAQQAKVQSHINTVLSTVDRAVSEKRSALANEKVNLTEEDLSLITDQASALIKQGKLQYDPKSVTDFYLSRIDAFAARLKAERQSALEAHAAGKPQFPPPPTGGAAPALMPKAPRNFREAGDIMANRLQTTQAQV